MWAGSLLHLPHAAATEVLTMAPGLRSCSRELLWWADQQGKRPLTWSAAMLAALLLPARGPGQLCSTLGMTATSKPNQQCKSQLLASSCSHAAPSLCCVTFQFAAPLTYGQSKPFTGQKPSFSSVSHLLDQQGHNPLVCMLKALHGNDTLDVSIPHQDHGKQLLHSA